MSIPSYPWLVIVVCVAVLIALVMGRIITSVRPERPSIAIRRALTFSPVLGELSSSPGTESPPGPTAPSLFGNAWSAAILDQSTALRGIYNTFDTLRIDFTRTFMTLNNHVEVIVRVPSVNNVMSAIFGVRSADEFIVRLAGAIRSRDLRSTVHGKDTVMLAFKFGGGGRTVSLPNAQVRANIKLARQDCASIVHNPSDCAFPSRQCNYACKKLDFRCRINQGVCEIGRKAEEVVNFLKRQVCKLKDSTERAAADLRRSACEDVQRLRASAERLAGNVSSSELRRGISIEAVEMVLKFRVLETTEISLQDLDLKVSARVQALTNSWWPNSANEYLQAAFDQRIKPRIEEGAKVAIRNVIVAGLNDVLS